MKIAIAQISTRVGDLSYNFARILEHYNNALAHNADICLFPELVTSGYIPEDLLFNKSFLKDIEQEIQKFIGITWATVAILPSIIMEDGILYNGALIIRNQQIIGKTTKVCLPNYGVFDEKRYFAAGRANIIEVNGVKIGIPICEDLWSSEIPLYLKNLGAEILLVPNASPYTQGKFEQRVDIASVRYRETGLPIIYCNHAMSQDGIVYDGRSFVYDGEIKYCAKIFAEDFRLVEVRDRKVGFENSSLRASDSEAWQSQESFPLHRIVKSVNGLCATTTSPDEIYCAMVYSLREYVANNGFSSVILGLSGGIDSALVAAIAVDSLGSSNVSTIMMPSDITSQESLGDAEEIAKLLGVCHRIIPISVMLKTAVNSIETMSYIAYQNLQARIRGTILMTISNSTNSLLLTTGNKSEIATGYTTLYGDMCGGFNPIKDLYKTEVFTIAKFRNCIVPESVEVLNKSCPVMPENVILKEPSAELAVDQRDKDSLPEYSILDRILYLHVEQDLSCTEIIDLDLFERNTVEKVTKLVKSSEYKRKQSAIGTKISIRDFAKDRRYPITNGY